MSLAEIIKTMLLRQIELEDLMIPRCPQRRVACGQHSQPSLDQHSEPRWEGNTESTEETASREERRPFSCRASSLATAAKL